MAVAEDRIEVWPGAGVFMTPSKNRHVTRIDYEDGQSAFLMTRPLVFEDADGDEFEVAADEIGAASWSAQDMMDGRPPKVFRAPPEV